MEANKEKKPYVVWQVGELELKLKLTTSKIVELEEKYKCNLISLISNGNVPPLAVMLNITHAAAKKYREDIKYKVVNDMFDDYVENGGSQTEFMTQVFLPIFQVSGFFSQAQTATMEVKLDEVKELI